MSDPFSSIRRKPAAAATYGRKAMAARRVGISHTASSGSLRKNDARPLSVPSLSSPSQIDDLDDDSEGSDSSSSGGGDRPTQVIQEPIVSQSHRASEIKGEVSEPRGAWAHRSAQSAMSKLNSLYESTKPIDPVPVLSSSTPREILDSSKNSWDIVSAPGLQHSRNNDNAPSHPPSAKTSTQPRRVVRDRTDIIINDGGSNSSSSKVASLKPKSRTAESAFSKPKVSRAAVDRKAQAASALPIHSSEESKSRPEKSATAKDDGYQTKRARNMTNTRTVANRVAKKATSRGMRAVESQMSNGSMSTDDDTWGIVGIIGGSPVLGPAKTVDGQRATASDILATSKTSRNRYRSAGFDRRSSSPPSSLHRRLERSRISGSSSSHSHAGHSSDCEQTAEDPIKHVMHTPKAQTGKRHAVQAMQGPSSATSKRLQKRAVRQNVVYTYGRSRENDDFDEVFGHQLGASRGLGAGSQQLLSYGDISDDTASKGATSDSEPRPTSRALTKPLKSAVSCSGHLLDLVDLPGSNGGNRSSSSEEFKKWFGDVTQGLFAIVNGSSPEAVCLQILDGLDKPSFFEELVNNKHWLPALLQSLHRARDSAVVLSTTMVVIASAFAVPTVMQVLVFERQVLETVADILKQTANVDVLLLRHRRDFDSSEQLQCVSRICKLVRQRELLGASVVVSTYNLAMCALHSFTRSDDVAFIAMAGLLRSEMRESGCLGLVAERVFLRSVPHFICKKEQTKAAGGCIEFDDICAAYAGARAGRKLRFGQAAVDSDSSDPEAGDMWMDFDLPEETKTVAQAAAIALLKQRKKGREATLSTAATRDSSIDPKRILRGEPEGSVPTFASIAVELELLRFCTSASADNQNEMLDIDTCVPSLLGLLTACQQAASSLNGVQLIRALETAALTLQLLVNLSNSSTMFSSRFVAERGLHVVSRSIALVSQRMQQDASSSSGSASSSDFSPRRQALLQDAGDLRYDILLITSALLTNLVESDASATLYFNHVLQSPRCALGSRCIPECICSDRTSLTTLLSQAFMACHGAGSSPDAAVAAGYIAVLLGFIMRNKTPSREAVLKRLPRRDTSIVITHIQQFIQVSDSVNQRFGGLIGGLAMAAQTHQTTAGIAGTIRETDSGRNAGNMLAVSSVSRSTAGGLVAKPASKIATSLQTIIDTLSAL